MKTRRSLATGAIAVMAFAAGAANAGMILAGTASHPPFGQSETANTTAGGVATSLIQPFTLSEDSYLSSVELFGYSPNDSAINVYITESIGPDATESNIQTSVLDAPVSQAGFTAMFHSVDLGNMAMSAGEYFLVVTSDDANGFQWRRVSPANAVNTDIGGKASHPSGEGFLNQQFSFFTNLNNDTFGFQLVGTVIPAPGSIALAGLSGVMLLGRRRR